MKNLPGPSLACFAALSRARELVQSVEGGSLVAFSQRWVVEDRLDKIFDRPTQNHHRLPDVEQFTRAFANDVHAEQEPRLAVENQLEAAGCIAANLTPRNLPVVSHSHLERHIFIGKLLFGFADKRNLRDRVDPVRIE